MARLIVAGRMRTCPPHLHNTMIALAFQSALRRQQRLRQVCLPAPWEIALENVPETV
ncbi:MAG: hypothetical protein HYY48_01260 [Gammaproteobacteria bacterium]|nr:hypothetical protein [Gammaproteobacteria bacterium]